MTTKKITPKKRRPNPVVVLEGWPSPLGAASRIVYDAIEDVLRVEYTAFPAEDVGWITSLYPDSRLAEMP